MKRHHFIFIAGAAAAATLLLLGVLWLFVFAPLRFSAQWKAAGPDERGNLRAAHAGLIDRTLRGKDRKAVLKFLGKPDGEESAALYYELGLLYDGPYRWTLVVLFDEQHVVEKIFIDD